MESVFHQDVVEDVSACYAESCRCSLKRSSREQSVSSPAKVADVFAPKVAKVNIRPRLHSVYVEDERGVTGACTESSSLQQKPIAATQRPVRPPRRSTAYQHLNQTFLSTSKTTERSSTGRKEPWPDHGRNQLQENAAGELDNSSQGSRCHCVSPELEKQQSSNLGRQRHQGLPCDASVDAESNLEATPATEILEGHKSACLSELRIHSHAKAEPNISRRNTHTDRISSPPVKAVSPSRKCEMIQAAVDDWLGSSGSRVARSKKGSPRIFKASKAKCDDRTVSLRDSDTAVKRQRPRRTAPLQNGIAAFARTKNKLAGSVDGIQCIMPFPSVIPCSYSCVYACLTHTQE